MANELSKSRLKEYALVVRIYRLSNVPPHYKDLPGQPPKTARIKTEPASESTTNARPQSDVPQLDLLGHQSPQHTQVMDFAATPSNELPSSGDTIPDPNLHSFNSNTRVSMRHNQGGAARMASEETFTSRPTPIECAAGGAAPNEVPGPDQLSKIGQRSRQLIKVIQTLDALNIDTTLQSLPKFVVVGDQSAGKSSIIEAACEIALPRAQGTCTRCPFQITTSNSNDNTPWKCNISLHYRYHYDSRSRASKDSPYPKWVEQDLDIHAFATTSDKEELNAILFRAQLAILNPNKDPQSFLTNDLPDESSRKAVAFAPNIIALDIEGPDLPELSFFDLPGAINVSERDNEQYLVTMVEELILHYLKDEKALVLLACAANQDMENSTAFRFVHKANARNRSMGVLTKPDLMDVGHNRVDNIHHTLRGEKFILGEAWYVTKQLSQEELDSPVPISHAQARQSEAHFFATTDPWKADGALGSFSDRFGIPRLQNAISDKLTDHIVKSLPEIQARVRQRIQEIEAELADFPEQVSYPSGTVFADIRKVNDAVISYLEGDGLENKFQEYYIAFMDGVRDCVDQGKPELSLGTPGFVSHVQTIESDDEQREDSPMDTTPTPAAPKKRKMDKTPIPASSKKWKGDATSKQGTPSLVKPQVATDRNGRPVWTGNISRIEFELADVTARFKAGATSGMPSSLNGKVTDHLAMKALANMKGLVDIYFQHLRKLCEGMLRQSVATALRVRRETQLFVSTKEIVHDYFEMLMEEQTKQAHQVVAAQMNRPLTFQPLRIEFWKEKLHRKRQETRLKEYWDMHIGSGKKPLSDAERQKKESDQTWIDRALGTDEYRKEIDAMAQVFAYFDIASVRMLDCIIAQVDYGLLHAIKTNLQQKLIEGLRAYDNAYCAELLAEDPERLRQRRALVTEKEKLMQAVKELDALPTSFDV